MKMKYFLSLIIFLFSISSWAYTQSRSVTDELRGGLNIPVVMLCYLKTTQACKRSQNPYRYFSCLHQQMEQHFICRQNRAFFRETSAIVSKVTRYQKVYVVQADVIASDHTSEYFIVDSRGEIFSPIANVDITNAPKFKYLKKLYHYVNLWPILRGSPRVEKMKNGDLQIIFRQVLLNGCYRCQRVGFAEIAFQFSQSGDFLGSKLLRLIPRTY